MPAIYSTCSADNFFPDWTKHPRVGSYDKGVLINGGAGVQDKRTLITPRGAVTLVTVDELKFLQSNAHFKTFVENGFMFVDEKATRLPNESDIEDTVEEELTEKDNGAQDTEKTYKALNKKAPKVDKED
ncbi:hypothetical protein [Yersinia phage vB_YenM_P744]